MILLSIRLKRPSISERIEPEIRFKKSSLKYTEIRFALLPHYNRYFAMNAFGTSLCLFVINICIHIFRYYVNFI